jgi:hypothetical protein
MIENYAIVVFWSEPDHAWIADAPDLKSCSAHGATPEEAISELNIAMAAWSMRRGRTVMLYRKRGLDNRFLRRNRPLLRV